ncbi:hypothetical protein H5410_030597 [Solanum commersonii]|uniref:Uncharacterized protein n=1 Tax=Solanum commersonii TaxID=4109 RepID=A0A9J5YEQ9_SOLCO|nr:hypothetical protein H5410_030597 [Solanum commersonii]
MFSHEVETYDHQLRKKRDDYQKEQQRDRTNNKSGGRLSKKKRDAMKKRQEKSDEYDEEEEETSNLLIQAFGSTFNTGWSKRSRTHRKARACLPEGRKQNKTLNKFYHTDLLYR